MMEPAYDSKKYEDDIYKKWEESGAFNPDRLDLPETAANYAIMMPPPNVTGVLHLGHALENSLMDIMARYQRMRGKRVLLLPGTDHAAVATQAKVEKILVEGGMNNPRQELGREKLLEKIRAYAEGSKATILKQIRKIGTSCDWSRLAYTLDEDRSRAVNEVFIRMYNDGLVYRGYRVVNWSVRGQSTCSDDELVHVERAGKLYAFKYGPDFPIAIATTRPETKLGDTAVAVHPADERYQKYVGRTFAVDVGAAEPLKIKVIADETVDPQFGTGAVGVTPAHSAADFEMYERAKANGEPIDLIPVIDQDGRMTASAGAAYAGLTAMEAREKFVIWLKDNGLLEKEEDIIQNVGTSDRFGDVVEALPMTQWFVNVDKKIPGKGKSLKDLMKEAVTAGHNGNPKEKITIAPERFEKIYFNWIDNLRDWCISRQIWWGHRIPVWYNKNSKVENQKSKAEKNDIYAGVEAPPGDHWEQDPDTLDTWFSSGLWTFSTLGWPKKTSNLKKFHPTSWMQMGYEILFFWMARMILMSTYALDEIPFRDVYIHGILRNEAGKKFSKSAGNNIDPLEIIDSYGCDALRLSLILGIAPGNDARFYEEKIAGARNLVNKLWNISRYVIANCELRIANCEFKNLTLADKWILDKIERLINNVTNDLENCRFSQAGERLREFTWNDLADWYLEVCKFEKAEKKNEILNYLLISLLKLWHPFIPFVTEAIWSAVAEAAMDKPKTGKMLIAETWPEAGKTEHPVLMGNGSNHTTAAAAFDLIKDVVTAIRQARAENKVEPAKKIKAVIYAGAYKDLIESQAVLIRSLRTGIEELEIKTAGEKIEGEIFIVAGGVEIYLVGAIDKDKEKARIKKEMAGLKKTVEIIEMKLANEEFAAKAPAAIVSKEKERLDGLKDGLKKLEEQLKNL